MNFEQLYNKDVSKFIEKKGSGAFTASYLSWAYAVKELKIAYPEATYQIVFYDNKPYLETNKGYFVTVNLFLTRQDRIDNLFETWTHPVLDNRFQPIKEPNIFQINTSTQRCLTKLIGIATGLGLSLYSGEDIPKDDIESIKEQDIKPKTSAPGTIPGVKPEVKEQPKTEQKPEPNQNFSYKPSETVNWINTKTKKPVPETTVYNSLTKVFLSIYENNDLTKEEKLAAIQERVKTYIETFEGLTLKENVLKVPYEIILKDIEKL